MNISTSDDCLLWLESPSNSRLVTGQGAVVVFSGAIAKSRARLQSLELCIDGQAPVHLNCGLARDDLAGSADLLHLAEQCALDTVQQQDFVQQVIESGGFWYAHCVPEPRTLNYHFKARFTDGSRVDSEHLSLQAERDYATHFCDDADPFRESVNAQMIATNADTVICLASYQPDAVRLQRQIESIQKQRYTRWVCIICDDSSSQLSLNVVYQLCKEDERFFVKTHTDNVGFYRNFERALHYVPPIAKFVALADQDDQWYPDKLDALMACLNRPEKSADPAAGGVNITPAQGPQLCYSDMRVVDVNGGVISETYWQNRRNNARDADIVLLANTVTGAACLMRSELLTTALPFPDRVGDAFHDHWLACCALSFGAMGYEDRPLYSYFQYDDSVIGHSDFVTSSGYRSLTELIARVGGSFSMLIRPAAARRAIIRRRASGLAIHHQECRRLELIVMTLKLRVQQPTISAQRAWGMFGHGARSGIKLLMKHVSVRFRGETTNHAEIRLGLGYLIDALDTLRIKAKRWRLRPERR